MAKTIFNVGDHEVRITKVPVLRDGFNATLERSRNILTIDGVERGIIRLPHGKHALWSLFPLNMPKRAISCSYGDLRQNDHFKFLAGAAVRDWKDGHLPSLEEQSTKPPDIAHAT